MTISSPFLNSSSIKSHDPNSLAAQLSRSLIRLETACFVVRSQQISNRKPHSLIHSPVIDLDNAITQMKSILQRPENPPESADILYVQSAARFYRLEADEPSDTIQIHLSDDLRLSLDSAMLRIDERADDGNYRLRYFKFMSPEQIIDFKRDLVMNPSVFEELSRIPSERLDIKLH